MAVRAEVQADDQWEETFEYRLSELLDANGFESAAFRAELVEAADLDRIKQAEQCLGSALAHEAASRLSPALNEIRKAAQMLEGLVLLDGDGLLRDVIAETWERLNREIASKASKWVLPPKSEAVTNVIGLELYSAQDYTAPPDRTL